MEGKKICIFLNHPDFEHSDASPGAQGPPTEIYYCLEGRCMFWNDGWTTCSFNMFMNNFYELKLTLDKIANELINIGMIQRSS